MTAFLPFKGILYDHSRVEGTRVLAPPYDVISSRRQEELYERSEYNVVRIDFGKEYENDDEFVNKYSRASQYLADWLSEGVLRKHDRDAFYIYEAEYRYLGDTLRLRGVIGRVNLVELGKGVYPHEETHSAPKKDRLNLLRACNANISPIFSLYNSPDRITSNIIEDTVITSPLMEAVDDWGVIHRMWIVDEESSIKAISSDISGKPIFIADGHHRYETAIAYQEEMMKTSSVNKDFPFGYVMMFLANIADSGLTILPTHRLINAKPDAIIKALSPFFNISTVNNDADITRIISNHERTIGMYLRNENGYYLLRPTTSDLEDVHPVLRELDVVVLHELILKKLLNTDIITYEMDAWRCIDMVKRGAHSAAFFLNPTRVEDIEKVALNSVRMPPKSTYFFPKLLTGFVINPFE